MFHKLKQGWNSKGRSQASLSRTGQRSRTFALRARLASRGRRWQQAVADAERFLSEWGDTAEGLGWKASDFFGLHPTVPLSRVDAIGLCWLLKNQRVVLLTATEARFE